MAVLLFLGAIILSYFAYKFLRQFFFVDYHLSYDANQSFPAINILAGRGELQEEKLSYNRPYNVSETSAPSNIFCAEIAQKLEDGKKPKSNLVKNLPRLKNSYQNSYAEEEYDMKKKERLYISALNRGRPRGKPKIRKLPNVGYLPTLFEKFPYPLTTEILKSCIEEESDDMREAENVTEQQIPVYLTAKKAEVETVYGQSAENTAEEVPLNVTPQLSKRKKKKFRKIRKFFSRLSCIHKMKEH